MKKRNLLCIFLISLSLVGCGADTVAISDPTPSTEDVATEVTTSTEDEEKLGLDAIENEKERALIEESMNKPQPAKSTTTKNKNKKETVEENTSETVKETEKKETVQKEEKKEVTNTTNSEITVNNTPAPTEQPQPQPQASEPAPSAPTSTEHVHTWVKTQIGTTSVTSDEIIGYEHRQIHGDEYAPIFDEYGVAIGQTLVSPAEYEDVPIYGSRNEPIYANVCSTCGASYIFNIKYIE